MRKTKSFTDYWLDACFSKEKPTETITAFWKDGHSPAIYPMNMLTLLKSDKLIQEIQDNQTGELLFVNR